MSHVMRQFAEAGQSVWLDFVSRPFLRQDGLSQLIERDGVSGLTTNPNTFERAIAYGNDYDESLREILNHDPVDAAALYERLAAQDIRTAADVLRPVHDRTAARDGFVSFEVAPLLAFDSDGTLREARRMLRAIGRPNLMLKIPGTDAGFDAMRSLVAEGTNVNLTLLFSAAAYRSAANAWMDGLEQRLAAGKPVARIAGVASFFLSRIDRKADDWIDEHLASADVEIGIPDAARLEQLSSLRGCLAIASARTAWEAYCEILASDRWQRLAAAGAQPLRLLWASTGIKDATYSETKYVDALIGPGTVCSMPPATLEAARIRRNAAPALASGIDEAHAALALAQQIGMPFDQMMVSLVSEGLEKFDQAYVNLLNALSTRRAAILCERQNAIHFSLPARLDQAVGRTLLEVEQERLLARLWRSDVTPWIGASSSGSFGWLAAAAGSRIDILAIERFAEALREDDIRQVVILGVGGASLGAEALAAVLGTAPSAAVRELFVLDSCDPDEILGLSNRLDFAHALFVVASKSGTTLETTLLHTYFYEQVSERLGVAAAARHFAVIAHGGTPLHNLAQERGYRASFEGDPQIGGAFSVLSSFGIVALAALGHDVVAFFDALAPMTYACAERVPAMSNPAGRLGVALAEAGRAGVDKVVILAPESLRGFGPWLSHLLSVATGKNGHGLIPILNESLDDAAWYDGQYGRDRLFVHLALDDDAAAREGSIEQAQAHQVEAQVQRLTAAGHAVISLHLASRLQIGQEFFRWQVAAALASGLLDVDPFAQPDVSAGAVRVAGWMASATAPASILRTFGPVCQISQPAGSSHSGFRISLSGVAASMQPSEEFGKDWRIFWNAARPGDYAALLTFAARNAPQTRALQQLAGAIRQRCRIATLAGFGPRYLHSVGQLFKGGPDIGMFVVITRQPEQDIEVADCILSLGQVEQLQALADIEQLRARGRRCLHLDIEGDLMAALDYLTAQTLS